jgi:hypothetical protein
VSLRTAMQVVILSEGSIHQGAPTASPHGRRLRMTLTQEHQEEV